jgi:hypothetical protein
MFLATAAAVAMAAVLLHAAVEKAHDLGPMAATVRALGFPSAVARPVAFFVTAAEFAVALAILFRPEATATHAAIVALAAVFAVAGLLALRSDEPIHCSCFGSGGRPLGLPQLLAFAGWVAGAGFLRAGISVAPPLSSGAAWFAATSLTLASMRAFAVWKAWREAHFDRHYAQEVHEWLPSH